MSQVQRKLTSNAGPVPSFWDVENYKRVVKRMESGILACDELATLIKERAAVEAAYAHALVKWAERWTAKYDKRPEFGTLQTAYTAMFTQAQACAEVHSTVNLNLLSVADDDLPSYRKAAYTKEFIGYKEVKHAKDGFAKAQKPWAKLKEGVAKREKMYNDKCAYAYKARKHIQDIQADSSVSPEDVLKHSKEADKADKDAADACTKYKHALDKLSDYNSKYRADMTTEFIKCQDIEAARVGEFKKITLKYHSFLDVSRAPGFAELFDALHDTLAQVDAARDAADYAVQYGAEMDMAWPAFREWDPAASSSSQQVDNGGSTSSIPQGSVSHSSDHYAHDGYDEHAGYEHAGYEQGHGDADYDQEFYSGLQVGAMATAQYDYDAQDKDELSFCEGDVIRITQAEDADGWCMGELHGLIGLLPANYVTQ